MSNAQAVRTHLHTLSYVHLIVVSETISNDLVLFFSSSQVSFTLGPKLSSRSEECIHFITKFDNRKCTVMD